MVGVESLEVAAGLLDLLESLGDPVVAVCGLDEGLSLFPPAVC